MTFPLFVNRVLMDGKGCRRCTLARAWQAASLASLRKQLGEIIRRKDRDQMESTLKKYAAKWHGSRRIDWSGRGLRTRLWGTMSTEPVAASSASLLVTNSEGDISLLDILDHVLNSGVVIHGSLVISLAGVDLIYVGLNVVLTSVETALRNMDREGGE